MLHVVLSISWFTTFTSYQKPEEKMETFDICRTCLKSSVGLKPLFDDMSLPRKIRAISSVKVAEGDHLPSAVCSECVVSINSAFHVRQTLINSDAKLKIDLRKFRKGHECEVEEREVSLAYKDDFNEATTVIKTEVFDYTPEESSFSQKCDQSTIKMEDWALERSLSPVLEVCESDIKVETVTINEKQHSSVTNAKSDKRVLCDYCGKQVLSPNLAKHILIHTGRPVSCKICRKVVKTAESLRSHMNMHNPPIRTCQYCGKTFKFRSSHIQHVRRQHTGEIKKHRCNFCDKAFAVKEGLAKHIRSHTGERPYPCEYCKKGFSSRNALNTHIRQHTNEKPFICGHCFMGFPQKVSLKTHIKSKHSEKISHEIGSKM